MKGKKYLMIDDYMVDQILKKIKRIAIKNLDDIKVLIITYDKLLDDITLKRCDIDDMCY